MTSRPAPVTARGLTTLALLALSVSACGDLPQRLTEAPPLARSSQCEVGGENVYGRPTSTPTAYLSMNNDGGWCWMMNSESERGLQYGPFLRVTQQPAHGKLEIAVLKLETRLAYRPDPGFIGEDSFQTVSEELNYRYDYTVNVHR